MIYHPASMWCKKAVGKVGDEVGPLSPSLLNCELYLAAITVVIEPAPRRTQRSSYSVSIQGFGLHTDSARSCSLPSYYGIILCTGLLLFLFLLIRKTSLSTTFRAFRFMGVWTGKIRHLLSRSADSSGEFQHNV